MITHKIAWEYTGYLCEIPAAYDGEIDALDLASECEHYYSWGPTEPIFSDGMGPRYRIAEVTLPTWASVRRYTIDIDYQYYINAIIATSKDPDNPVYRQLYDARLSINATKAIVKLLETNNHKSPFIQSLHH